MDTEFKSTHAVKTWCIVEQQRSKLVVGHPDPMGKYIIKKFMFRRV